MTSTILPPGAVYALTDIRAHDVTYPGYNQVLVPAYVARPAAPGRHPGLLVVHGIHGHEEHMKDVARRFAIHGYVALLPALYCREEFVAVVEEEDLQKAAVWLRERPNAQTIGDLAGALTFLQTAPYVSERIGLVGFCSGGRLALLFACHSEGLRVFINFYSNGLLQTSAVNPISPLAMVPTLACPMLGLFGDEDTNPSPTDVTRLQEALEAHAKPCEIVRYPHAGHAFFSDTRPSYRPEVAYMAWGRCLEWLSRHLKP